MRKRTRSLLVILIFVICLFGFLYHQNNSISITTYPIISNKLPQSFDGYRIIQLSDLHNKRFGQEQQTITEKVKSLEPDLIVVTGDLLDKSMGDDSAGVELMEKMTEIAPVYFVTGNHEWWSGRFDSLERQMTALGVRVMRNVYVRIDAGRDSIYLIGIDDPANGSAAVSEAAIVEERLIQALQGAKITESYSILLSHRPELLHVYARHDADLVFAGHAHGGQIRLPFIGGLVAPNQGWFPAFTSGMHSEGSTTMIISRGLGNSIIPQRIFNRPEIVVVDLFSD